MPIDHADDVEQRDERDRGAEHQRQAAQAVAARQPVVAGVARAHRADEQQRREHRHHDAEPERQERRPGAVLAPVRVVLQRAGAERDGEREQAAPAIRSALRTASRLARRASYFFRPPRAASALS